MQTAIAGAMAWMLSAPTGVAAEARLVAGGGGWRLERFEGEVAILRTDITDVARGRGRPGLFLLSCIGAERRVRITVPDHVDLGTGSVRRTLVKAIASPASVGKPVLVRLALDHGQSLTHAETDAGPDSVVLGLARLLALRPAALDILTYGGDGAIPFRKIVPISLALTFGAHDGIALDHFVAACLPIAR